MLTVKNFNHTCLITFKDYDDTVLSSERVLEWNMPTTPPVPPRACYDFTWWSPSVGVVTQDQIYTATYDPIYDFTSLPMSNSTASQINAQYKNKGLGTSDFNWDYGFIYNCETEGLAYWWRIKYSFIMYVYAFAYYYAAPWGSLKFAIVNTSDCPYTQEEIENSFATMNPPKMDKDIWEYVKTLDFK